MNTLFYIRRFGIVLLILFLITSCDSLIYEHEGDCLVSYRLKFRYDMNLKFADAFAHEVKSVRLYAFNMEGELVWQASEQGEVLASENYVMALDLAPGKYRLVAWCGLGNEESFCLPDVSPACGPEGLHCCLNCISGTSVGTSSGGESPACSDKDLQPLFHGMMDVELPVNDDGGEYTFEMSLTKNTNVFRVVLQHLSGEDIDADDFEFSIEDNNGWLAYDNSMLRDVPVVYRPWAVYSGEAGVETTPKRAITSVKVAVAELTVNRLFMRDWTKYKRSVLTIRTVADGKLVASIPIIDYVLLVKGEHHRQMDDQEYLDRADEYNMTFFLDQDNNWISTVVQILSWRVVVNNSDLN
ncbi:FimB/Mfa2 family fimbrial subunit [Bacteroides sp. K03]|uniref:FimB/Mfa2 family fimbrial subunit n=1 Tax=Bacteroides TaxID=816 RepID=UPI001C8B82A2|nr:MULTISPECIES: FimB/Mfa2 family fimbrial subunit [unclassified Bacteroides]MBX9187742.1 FimB/Mfa2 family fimbrial subunit [Bacteroides sp. K03]